MKVKARGEKKTPDFRLRGLAIEWVWALLHPPLGQFVPWVVIAQRLEVIRQTAPIK